MGMEGPSEKVRTIGVDINGASRAAFARAVKAGGEEVFSAYQDQFARAVDPYGSPWPAGQKQPGKIHYQTGRLANPMVRVTRTAVTLQIERYGWIHHVGWVKQGGARVDRQVVPYRDGSWWWPAIQQRVNAMIRGELARLSARTGGSYSDDDLDDLFDE